MMKMTKMPSSENVKFNNWMTLIKSIEYKCALDEIESTWTELILSIKYRVVN